MRVKTYCRVILDFHWTLTSKEIQNEIPSCSVVENQRAVSFRLDMFRSRNEGKETRGKARKREEQDLLQHRAEAA